MFHLLQIPKQHGSSPSNIPHALRHNPLHLIISQQFPNSLFPNSHQRKLKNCRMIHKVAVIPLLQMFPHTENVCVNLVEAPPQLLDQIAFLLRLP